jgi:hypothetical protein
MKHDHLSIGETRISPGRATQRAIDYRSKQRMYFLVVSERCVLPKVFLPVELLLESGNHLNKSNRLLGSYTCNTSVDYNLSSSQLKSRKSASLVPTTTVLVLSSCGNYSLKDKYSTLPPPSRPSPQVRGTKNGRQPCQWCRTVLDHVPNSSSM